jgi:PKD repeat protein
MLCDSGTVSYEVAPVDDTIHVGDLDGEHLKVRNKWNAIVTITIHDAMEGPVSEATVSGTWSGGATGSGDCITDADGQCQVTKETISAKVSRVVFTVDNVTYSDVAYDAPANHDPDGDSDGTTITVNLGSPANQVPVAAFGYSCADLTCDFDATDSNDPDGSIVSYGWDFGDGTTGGGVAIRHTYATAGSYPVVLTVTDDGGATDTDTQNVVVGTLLTMHVGDLDGSSTSGKRGDRWNATVMVTIHDQSHGVLAGASVSGSWTAGTTGVVSCVTDVSGQCTVTKGNLKGDITSVTFTVDSVLHDNSEYEPGDNHDPDGDSDGTSITIGRPWPSKLIRAWPLAVPC